MVLIIENNLRKQQKIEKENFVSFCDLFRGKVKANPSAIAAIYEEGSLTYKELDQRSSQLAVFLRTIGVKSETIIAVCLHNGLDLLVSFLGILKSGGAYLPIDPNYPAERVESILKDAEPAVVLTEQRLKDIFSSKSYKVVLKKDIPHLDFVNEDELIHSNQLAYVVYTSGSTGKPKGIMIEHGALSHAVSAYQDLHPNKIVSLMAGSISFDASLLVISHTLSSGGTVYIPKSDIVIDPEQIIILIKKFQINYTLCIPSFYSMLLNKSQNLPSLQSIDLGGETLSNDIPMLHAEFAPNAVLYNVYGPSEYSVGATFAKIYDPISKQINKITVGKPLPNTQIYILDEDFKHVPIGLKGEIFIGGNGLARGYLNQEDLTSERFIWMSFPDQEPIRLYKTGDYGRFLSDGNIELLGRMDHQVKMRGYRIELGEVEYFIAQYPEINEVVVIAQGDIESHKQLVAYYSARTKEQISEKLRTYLQNVLPHYMVPSAFIPVEDWPRTPNGKIDRATLSKLPKPSSNVAFEQPMLEMEKTLFQIWKQILGRERFGIKDNFFELGGDSLQIVNMQTTLEEMLDIKINISVLFQYPTISQLANYLCSAKDASSPKNEELVKKQKSAFQQFKKFSNRG